MIIFSDVLHAWGSENFETVLKNTILNLDQKFLPLQQAVIHGNYATNDRLSVMLLDTRENTETLEIKTGLFFTSVIAGCQCADDPTPMDEYNEYCEVLFRVHKVSAQTEIELLTV